MAMLDMLIRGGFIGTGEIPEEANKRKGEKEVIWPKVYIVYVEFAGVVQGGQDRMELMERVAKERKIDFFGLRAEDVFDPELAYRLGSVQSNGQPLSVDLKQPCTSSPQLICEGSN